MHCKIQSYCLVNLPELFREIQLTLLKSGVQIEIGSFVVAGTEKFDNHRWSMSWAEAADPETIAVACEFETVAVFRKLVEMLGVMCASHHVFGPMLCD